MDTNTSKIGKFSFITGLILAVLFSTVIFVGLLNRFNVIELPTNVLQNGIVISIILCFVLVIISVTTATIDLFKKESSKVSSKIALALNGYVLIVVIGFAVFMFLMPVNIGKVNIYEYGHFQKVYKQVTSGELTLVEKTDTIVAQIGNRFGFKYEIDGEPRGRVIQVNVKWSYPPPGRWDSASSQYKSSSTYQSSNSIGAYNYCGYKFDYQSELIPGQWICEVWYDDINLCNKKFIVIVK